MYLPVKKNTGACEQDDRYGDPPSGIEEVKSKSAQRVLIFATGRFSRRMVGGLVHFLHTIAEQGWYVQEDFVLNITFLVLD